MSAVKHCALLAAYVLFIFGGAVVAYLSGALDIFITGFGCGLGFYVCILNVWERAYCRSLIIPKEPGHG